MKLFMLRLTWIAVIIGTLLINTLHTKAAFASALFILSGIFCFYFLMPVVKIPLINFILILLLISLSSFISTDHAYWLPLIGFMMVEATILLKGKHYFIFCITSIVVSIMFSFVNNLSIYDLLLMATIFVVCYLLYQFKENAQLKASIYDELLMEYRLLKRMSVEQEQLVRAEERTKIARDIHDSVGHKLTSLLMQLEVISIQNSMDSIGEAKQLARESLEETRYAVRQLKSAETTGIQSVIQLIRKLEMESRLHIRFTLEKGVLSLPLSNKQSVVIYRVLQESLTNAMKYSHSKEVEVILGVNSLQHLQFEVKNKLISNNPIIQGFGLSNMEDRLREIGGELSILRTDQHFILRGTFPIKKDKNTAESIDDGVKRNDSSNFTG
ncbi:sensor histidine kinase [Ureibacillus aquaedulcis]|uniref:histidine kinase n=1 Tax=Ureibacillus aquaedulcis TaxID=3058421 RepID=A0ABT8GPE2_9BACL|nr:histidine kinase [Ureibacillus sp. BA0131]MDN4493283.1 histidine kinase [Ureibacillus sp. BA0131]